MKTMYMGTTALALTGLLASPAAAAEWNVRVGGFMEQYVGYANVDDIGGDFDGVDTAQDAEIWFLPSITLDNGIKIGANVQLEGNTGGDQIDESYLFVDGSFGELLLGSENSAGYKMHYSAPDVTFININSGSLSFFIPFSGTAAGVSTGDDQFRRTLGTTFLENVGNNDSQRITYFSPRFAGFQVGASYARDGLQDSSGPVDADTSLHDIFDIGANYVNSFGDFSVAVSGRWGTASAADASGAPDPDIWSAGLNLGFAGFTIGGSYAEQNDAGVVDGEAYDAGISYETGPWGVSFTYQHGENVDDENPLTDEELDQFLVGVAYKLAKGVDLNAYGAYVEFDEELSDAGVGNGDDIDAFVIGTGIKISF
jgi:predicted porin